MTKRKLVSRKSQFQNSVREVAEALGWKVMLTYLELQAQPQRRARPAPESEPPRVIFAELKIARCACQHRTKST